MTAELPASDNYTSYITLSCLRGSWRRRAELRGMNRAERNEISPRDFHQIFADRPKPASFREAIGILIGDWILESDTWRGIIEMKSLIRAKMERLNSD